MSTIKKYANGRFYDTENKKYLKKEEVIKLVASKKKVKVVLSKTGKDVTKTLRPKVKTDVRAKAKKKTEQVSASVKKWATENKKWLSDNMDKRISKVLKVMNLPTKDQVVKLDKSIRTLNKKVKELETLQAKKLKVLEKAQAKQDQKMKKLEMDQKK